MTHPLVIVAATLIGIVVGALITGVRILYWAAPILDRFVKSRLEDLNEKYALLNSLFEAFNQIVPCPYCGHFIVTPEHWVEGSRVKCPNCEETSMWEKVKLVKPRKGDPLGENPRYILVPDIGDSE